MPQTTGENRTSNSDYETIKLGFGTMLVVESDGGGYEPIAMVSTIREARELAEEDLKIRMDELEKGSQPMCPARYVIWKRGEQGTYRIVSTIETD